MILWPTRSGPKSFSDIMGIWNVGRLTLDNASIDFIQERDFQFGIIVNDQGRLTMRGTSYINSNHAHSVLVEGSGQFIIEAGSTVNANLLTRDRALGVRFIEFMPFGDNGWKQTDWIGWKEIRNRIEAEGFELAEAEREPLSGPADEYRVFSRLEGPDRAVRTEHRGRVGFITPISDRFISSIPDWSKFSSTSWKCGKNKVDMPFHFEYACPRPGRPGAAKPFEPRQDRKIATVRKSLRVPPIPCPDMLFNKIPKGYSCPKV